MHTLHSDRNSSSARGDPNSGGRFRNNEAEKVPFSLLDFSEDYLGYSRNLLETRLKLLESLLKLSGKA
jgi:hypothetical protein